MTKDEKESEDVLRAVETLKIHVPPESVKDATAIAEYYAIFNGPARWKAGVRTPQETRAPSGKATPGFKRMRGI